MKKKILLWFASSCEISLFISTLAKFHYLFQHYFARTFIERMEGFNHPLQTEIVNCGVYVLFYLIIILKSSSIVSCIPDSMKCIDGSSNPFNADTLRLILQNFLLAPSEAVHDSCAICSRQERKDCPNLCCFRCERWVHNSYNSRDYFPPDTSATEVTSFQG